MRTLVWSLGVLALTVCLCSLSVVADTAYTNLQSGSYQCCIGWTTSGPGSLVGEVEDAQLFTSLTTGNVTSVSVALGFVTGDNGATISLWSDAGGVPGVNLSGFINLPAAPVFGSTTTILTSANFPGTAIVAGQPYFLVILADNVTWDAWNWNDTGAVGQLDQNTGNGWNQFQGQTLGGMAIFTSSQQTVPEPASLFLLGTGLIGLGRVVRKKR